MREILPGVFHWTATHEGIGVRVSSYYVELAGALIDPLLPDEGLDAFAGHARPQQVLLTSAHHARDADRFTAAFGCVVRASPQATQRLGDALEVDAFSHGEEVAPAIAPLPIGRLSDDECALHIAIDDGAIMFADSLNRYAETLGFFPDMLLGDDPAAVKKALSQRFRALLDREFDHLLFAHGEPLIGGGRAALRAFIKQRDER